jgi:polar amino acid transport system permease protein
MFSLHALLDALPYLIKAAQATVLISLVGLMVGFIVAIAVCSARLSKNFFVSKLGGAYVGFFRGVPLLV